MPPIKFQKSKFRKKISDLRADKEVSKEINEKLSRELKQKLKKVIKFKDPLLHNFIDSLNIDVEELSKNSLSDFVTQVLLPQIKKSPSLNTLAEKIEVDDEEGSERIENLVDLETPLDEHPLFMSDVRLSKIEGLASITAVGRNFKEKLEKIRSPFEELEEDEWDELVESGALSREERKELETNAAISRLSGYNYELVSAIREAGITDPADLAEWEKADWDELFKHNKIESELETEEYTEIIQEAVKLSFPHRYFINKHSRDLISDKRISPLVSLKRQLKEDHRLFEKFRNNDLDASIANDASVTEKLRDLDSLVMANRQLQLSEIINSDELDFDNKTLVMERRLKGVSAFLKNNREIDLLEYDFLEPGQLEKIDWQGIHEEDKLLVRNQVMAYQRMLNLADDPDTSKRLLDMGFDSASRVTQYTFSSFQAKSGLSIAEASQVYSKAIEMTSKASHAYAMMKEMTDSGSRMPHALIIDKNLVNDLKDIDGYQQLFGSQNYCECEHCKSIFSPAAYFTDLMHFIDKEITEPVFANSNVHALSLKTRRPDLWKLELSCFNTNTVIPHLTIVNEILEAYLENTLHLKDVYKTLSTASTAAELPFNLPLESARTYIDFFGTNLASVYETLGADKAALLKENLNLYDHEFLEITKESGHDWIEVSDLSNGKIDVVTFLKYAHITREQLDDLIGTDFISRKLNLEVLIVKNSGDLQDFKEVLNNVNSTSLNRAGRFLRLWRKTGWNMHELDSLLVAVSGDDAIELDITTLFKLSYVKLLHLSLGTSIEETISLFANVPTRSMKKSEQSLATRLFVKTGILENTNASVNFSHASLRDNSTVEITDPRLGALLATLAISEDDLVLLMQNLKKELKVNNKGSFPLNLDSLSLLYRHSRIPALLNYSIYDYLLILNHCQQSERGFTFKSVVPKIGKTGSKFNLRIKNSKSFEFKPMFPSMQMKVENLDDEIYKKILEIDRVTDFLKELKDNNVSADLFSKLTGNKSVSADKITTDMILVAVSKIKSERQLYFSTSVLTAIPGIDEASALMICEFLVSNQKLIKEGDSFLLTSTFTDGNSDELLPLEIKANEIIDKELVEEAFLNYHPLEKFNDYFIGQLQVSAEGFALLLPFAGELNEDDLFAVFGDLPEEEIVVSSSFKKIARYIKKLSAIHDLFRIWLLEADDIYFIDQQQQLFGINDLSDLSEENVLRIASYARLLSINTQKKKQIRALLKSYAGAGKLKPGKLGPGIFRKLPLYKKADKKYTLQNKASVDFSEHEGVDVKPVGKLSISEVSKWAVLSGKDISRMTGVFASGLLPENAIEALGYSLRLYDVCSIFGISAKSLPVFLKRDFEGYVELAGLLKSSLKNTLDNKESWLEANKKANEKLNALKRNALCDYIISKEKKLNFQDRKDIYNYFLIDPEMAGCFETSRVVAAISSLQVYINRCLLNLEQSKSTNINVARMIDTVNVNTEWEWMKNYRVWEANRKIFLYPENYLEPALRDDKSPLFKQLEDELLGRPVTLENAEIAYTKYLKGFSEVSQLKIAGSCIVDRGDEDDQHYIFLGRTPNDPYQYYYRKYFVAKKYWTYWEKIDMGISSPYASPVMFNGRLFIFWTELNTQEKSKFARGNSIFLGYEHELTVNYSYLNIDKRWAATQKFNYPVANFIDRHIKEAKIELPFIPDFSILNIDKRLSTDWKNYYRDNKVSNKIYPYVTGNKVALDYLRQTPVNIVKVNNNELTGDEIEKLGIKMDDDLNVSSVKHLYYHSHRWYDFPNNQTRRLTAPVAEITDFHEEINMNQDPQERVKSVVLSILDANHRLSVHDLNYRNNNYSSIDASLQWIGNNSFQPGSEDGFVHLTDKLPKNHDIELNVVLGSIGDSVMSVKDESYLIRRSTGRAISARRHLIKLSSSLGNYLEMRLFNEGLDEFLSLYTQQKKESPFIYEIKEPFELKEADNTANILPFKGPYGNYLREMFFHIPILISSHLNATFRFKESKYWLEKVYNPTESGKEEQISKDIVWRYKEFRKVPLSKMKDILSDKDEIETYHKDPFNPYAIARLRISAFQKSTVMKYIDNMIDWADALFTRDTMESVNEALMLYSVAYDILGQRPIKTGKCKTAGADALTYEKLGPAIEKGSEFLMMVENKVESESKKWVADDRPDRMQADDSSEKNKGAQLGSIQRHRTGAGPMRKESKVSNRSRRKKTMKFENISERRFQRAQLEKGDMSKLKYKKQRNPGQKVVVQVAMAFCIPYNENLLAIWNRLDDRLFKIRNCMNIKGEKRQLALFEPPLDPMLLVRAKEAGIPLEDILAALSDKPPIYRFASLIERAKNVCAIVQVFGNGLLSALERRDAEELSLLRVVHEKNLLEQLSSSRLNKVQEAQKSLLGLQIEKSRIEQQVAYYSGLVEEGLIPAENLQQKTGAIASEFSRLGNKMKTFASFTFLIPNAGSPFAMTYGGREVGNFYSALGDAVNAHADDFRIISDIAGSQAGYQRRNDEWNFALKQSQQELKKAEKDILIAEIGVMIAENELKAHEMQVTNSEDVYEFLQARSTGLGMYNFLAGTLSKLYRDNYAIADQLARMAESAFRFELNDDTIYIRNDNWQYDQNGLLAAEKLSIQLSKMEIEYLQKNKRKKEITQSFSMTILAPEKLMELKRTGTCTDFELPEFAFDLIYPGHYRRIIKSVQITIPCIAGPYTNIGARLTLKNSSIRKDAILDNQPGNFLKPAFLNNTSISTSSAQNDSGLFILNFQDERLLPFEGAGALSTWTLELPGKIRSFDYNTIADVIFQVSYTAEDDNVFRGQVEEKMAEELFKEADTGLQKLFSLKHDFPAVYFQLSNRIGNDEAVQFSILQKHFPYLFANNELNVEELVIYLKPVMGRSIKTNGLSVDFNETKTNSWEKLNGQPDEWVKSMSQLKNINPVSTWKLEVTGEGFNKEDVDDILLLIRYTIKK